MFGGQEYEEKTATECADKQAVGNEDVREKVRSWKPNEDSLLRKK